MSDNEPRDISEILEKSLQETVKHKYILSLYVAGTTPRSARAIENVKKICEEQLKGCYDLEIIDVYQEPEKAKQEQLIALPTLIKSLPAPLRRIIGDLSDRERVLVGLDMKQKG